MSVLRHVLACAATALVLAGCGISTGSDVIQGDRAAAEQREEAARERLAAEQQRRSSLPSRPDGSAEVSVSGEQSLLKRAVEALQSRNSSMSYGVRVQPADSGFEDLCAGRIDLLQTSRPITRDELARCRANGLSVGSPVTIGFTTAIVVTRNRVDLGGDCMTVAGLQQLLRRGSTIRNWQDVGFADKPFGAMTLPLSSGVMQTVGRVVFDKPIGEFLASDLRGDLRTVDGESRIGSYVSGDDLVALLDRRVAAYRTSYAQRRRSEFAATRRRLVNEASRRVVAQIGRENRARSRRKEAVRDPAGLRRRNAQRVAAAQRSANRVADRQERVAVARAARQFRNQNLAETLAPGRLGIVSYPYYEAHADMLRPLEVDPRDGRERESETPNCRFPSQATINAQSYPLARGVFVYGDDRRLTSLAARTLIAHVLDENARLVQRDELTPLSTASANRVRRRLRIPVPAPASGERDGETTTTTTTTTPQQPSSPPSSGVPGIGAAP